MRKPGIHQALAVSAVAVTLAFASLTQPVAAAATTAGLEAAASLLAASSSERSATVGKSEAGELLESLAEAPVGKQWSWVFDSEARAIDKEVWKTSDGMTFDSEAEAEAYCASAKVTYKASTRSVPCWRTSDGEEFDSEDEARAHAASVCPSVAASTRQVDCWVTSDGKSFDDEAEVKAYMSENAMTVSESSRDVPCWETSDGQVFDDEESADAYVTSKKVTVNSAVEHVDIYVVDGAEGRREFLSKDGADDYALSLRPKVVAETRHAYSWTTSDGQSFATEAEARAHATTTVPEVTSTSKTVDVVTWHAGGKDFSDEAAARAYADAQALDVADTAYTVHHDAVTEKVVYYTIVQDGVEVETVAGLDKTVERMTYWMYEHDPNPENKHSTSYYVDRTEYKTITPAYDEVVARWTTSDGQSFATEAEARAHATTTVPEVTSTSKTVDVVTWHAGGKDFSDEAAARAYADAQALSVEQRDDPYQVWIVADGAEFDEEGAALAHADSLMPSVSSENAERTVFSTSDGASFLDETSANKHAEEASPSAFASTKQVPCWVTSDGKSFDSLRSALEHAEESGITYEKSIREQACWVTSDGKSFDDETEAVSYASSKKLSVASSTHDVACWVTSDGKSFDDEAGAAAYARDAKVTSSKSVERDEVEETGHFELVESDEDSFACSDDSNRTSPNEDGLPQTGDSMSLAWALGGSFAGSGSLVAAALKRRGI